MKVSQDGRRLAFSVPFIVLGMGGVMGCESVVVADADQVLPNTISIPRSETSVATLLPSKHCPAGSMLIGHNGTVGIPGVNVAGLSAYYLAPQLGLSPSLALSEHYPTNPVQFNGADLYGILQAARPNWRTLGDPRVAAAAHDGTLLLADRYVYTSLVADDQGQTHVAVWMSENCGLTWSHFDVIGDPDPFDPSIPNDTFELVSAADMPNLYVDPERPNVVYLVAVGSPHIGPVPTITEFSVPYISMSIDGGGTFSRFHRVQAGPADVQSVGFGSAYHPTLSSRGSTATNVLAMTWSSSSGCNPTTGVTRRFIKFSTSADQGTTWTAPVSVDALGTESRCTVAGGVPLSNIAPSLVHGVTSGQFVIAASYFNRAANSEQVVVASSRDGRTWNRTLEVPVGQSEGTTNRDQFFPILIRNRFILSHDEVLLAWYDTRESPDNRSVGIYALGGTYDGTTWTSGYTRTGSPDERRRSLRRVSSVLFPALLPMSTAERDRTFGDYWSGDIFRGTDGTWRYLLSWSDTRTMLPSPAATIAAATVRVEYH